MSECEQSPKKCVFPFVYKNQKFMSCSWYRNYLTDLLPWCPTQGVVCEGEAGDQVFVVVDSAGVYHSPQSASCSSLAVCRPGSGLPVSSLHCDPAPASCPDSEVIQVCHESYAGHAIQLYWCVRRSNKMMVHDPSCPTDCLPPREAPGLV